MILFPLSLWAVEKPEWELGAGYLEGVAPHYTGSNEYYRIKTLFPYFIYRTPELEVGESGSRIYLYHGNGLEVEFTIGGRLPIWTEDADKPAPEGIDDPNTILYRGKSWRRRGMDDTPAAALFGVVVNYHLGEHLSFSLPIYQGVGLIRHMPNMGVVGGMSGSYDFFERKSAHALILSYSRSYGDERFNQTYYGVPEEDALPGRPAYQARNGFIKSAYGVGGSFYLGDHWILGLYWAREMLGGSELTSSPLVVTEQGTIQGALLIYKFLASEKKVKIRK